MKFGVFIYEGVEPIDLATFGVLSMARRVAPQIELFTVAPTRGRVALSNGLIVLADHGINDCPDADWLIVTGGPGWAAQCERAATLAFVRGWRGRGPHMNIASVCTGRMILAAAGVLDGLTATTKREVIGAERQPLALMRERYPSVQTVEARFVDAGPVVTGGGVSLCIDTTLHLLERALGQQVAGETARIIEYQHAGAANRAALPEVFTKT